MKRLMLLAAVASLATLFVCASAAAQTAMAPQTRIMKVSCKGNSAVCTKLDLYQKMASTGGNVAASQGGAMNSAEASHNPAAARQGQTAAGGVENNPAEGSGGSMIAKLNKNASRQVKMIAENGRHQSTSLMKANRPVRSAQAGHVRSRVMRRGEDPTGNNPFSSDATAQTRARSVERAASHARPSAGESRANHAVRARMTYRYNPSDF